MATFMNDNSTLSLPWDYFIRKEFNEYAKKINFTLIFVQTFVVVFGLLGNILALIVINRKSLRNTSSSVFITYMAIFDSAVLLLHAAHLARPRHNLFIHCSLTYLTDLFTFCANWVLVVITLERCIAVSSPFHAKRFCAVKSARTSVSILLAIAIIIFSSTFPIIYHVGEGSNRRKCHIRHHLGLVHRIYQPIVLYGIPDLLLLSNFFTAYALIRRGKEQTQRLSDTKEVGMYVFDFNSNRKQRQLTIMLVTVNLAFYLFTTPGMIFYIAEYYPPKDPDISKLKRSFVFSQISVLLLQLNNATNFIFYCLAGQRFRQVTMETFREYSDRLITFYNLYIVCRKHYIPPQRRQSHCSLTRRISNPGKIYKHSTTAMSWV